MKKSKLWAGLGLCLMLVAAGCGNNNAVNTGSTNSGNATAATEAPANAGTDDAKSYKIAISQYVEHPSLDATREGFLAALKDAGIVEGENLTVDFQNAQADQANNLSVAQKIAGDKNDLVLGIATPSAQALVQNVKDTPILFAAVTDPLDAKIVSDLEHPGGNVSGASDTNPEAITRLMNFIATQFPDVKKLGLIINEGEPNAVVMSGIAKEELDKHGIELVKAAITNTSEVKQAAESLLGRVDAFYITLDNSVVSGVDAIIQTANDNKLPFFSADRDTVEKGAFATVGFKYYDHGYQVGEMAADVLKNGTSPGDMKVSMQEKLDLILNLKAAAAQGIEVTDAMKAEVADQANNIIQ
ncbi:MULTISPECIES: ABC transporter substrate-binding protein [unclassified Paenibacillus]|uniref:ABC transporter substrate-binding protein n=1 Tax=unclassified Paenibacillus TaxID=185978 RepID=UPI002404DDEB|nr:MULTISPECIES: ABC transporter substrate-binding protein [unclassified Paenibacillus]MDF9842921.1 putative ABC transport system substrate-binding protein [Paenibacillus sp. PastF-2]MDF9849509.1 putative ABC transport system substrate-binding protein [Paenibacillus sp. PastM-2]MDF9856116.1 putative ABC transport system substrate-binding protein [Paenibacillus sp. PastF-1]MDH6481352.1 putative ABC transport system substrate-binding protein [Paenibacillus sp. PastH-2]MDH6508805.1 putative ABC t